MPGTGSRTVGFDQAGAAMVNRGVNRIDSIRQTPRLPGGSSRSRNPGASGGKGTVCSCQSPRPTANRTECFSLLPCPDPK